MKNRVNIVSDFFNTQSYLANTFNIALRKSIINELQPSQISDKKILDIGCGDGSLSIPYIPTNQVIAIDSAKNMLERAEEKFSLIESKYKPQIIEGDFLAHSFTEKFDLILCIGVVAHIDNVESLFAKIHNLLQNNGRAIIQISDANHFRYKKVKSSLQDYGYELNRTGKKEFIQKLNSNGFKLLKQSGYSWSFSPINRLSQKIQFTVLNIIRKIPVFQNQKLFKLPLLELN